MDLKDIQELIKFVAKSGATEVDLEFDNVKISIKSPSKKRRGEVDEVTTIIQQVPGQVGVAPIVSAAAPIASTPAPATDENANYITIKASMIGTFYRSSSPEIPPFISVGDIIKEGDALCIIEAMKMETTITANVDATVKEIILKENIMVNSEDLVLTLE